MKIEVTDELKNVARPKKLRKAVMVTCLIIINDILIFVAASLLLREYLQINTKEAFGPGLTVSGHLTSDSLEVTVDEPQNAIFRSQSSNSAVSVRAAASHTAKLVLGKTSSPDWGIANNPADQLVILKGERSFLMMDSVTTTSTISTHVDMEDNSFFGAPLIMSTGGPIPSHACTMDAECGAGQCSGSGVCYSGVVAEDILLAPGAGGTIRLNAPIESVKGDLVFKPEQRIVVRKQSGAVGTAAAQFLLENTHLKLLNPSAATCVTTCLSSGTAAQQATCSAACTGVNSIKTLNAEEAAADPYGHEGSLSLSDKMYLHPSNTGLGSSFATAPIVAQAATGFVVSTGVITTANPTAAGFTTDDVVKVTNTGATCSGTATDTAVTCSGLALDTTCSGEAGCTLNAGTSCAAHAGTYSVTAVSTTTLTVSGLTGADPTTAADCSVERTQYDT